MGKLREFIEEVLAGRVTYRDFKFGYTKGKIGCGPFSSITFRIRFDSDTKKGRRIMREFADLFDQIEGMEWIEEREVKTRQWTPKTDITKKVRKGLKLQYQHMSDPITHSTHTVG